MVSSVAPHACPTGASTRRLPTRAVFLPNVLDTPYSAKLGPRDSGAVRARSTFESARLGATVHLVERGQAGHETVLAICGAVIPGATVSREVDVWIACDTCRRLRVERQKWTRA